MSGSQGTIQLCTGRKSRRLWLPPEGDARHRSTVNALIPIADLWKWIIGRPCVGAAASVIRLEKRGLEHRTLRPGGKLQCVKGTLWITVAGEGRDVILQEGAIYATDRSIRVLIEALEDAVVGLWPD